VVNPLHRESLTIQIVTTGAPDEDGLPTQTSTESTFAGFNVQPVISARSTEGVDNQTLVTKRWKVSGPPIPGLTADSRILWRGSPFKPWGDVTAQHYAVMPHSEFYMIDWAG
jgi:hypothetical protein